MCVLIYSIWIHERGHILQKTIQDQFNKVRKSLSNSSSSSEPAVGHTKIKIRWQASSDWHQTDFNVYTAKSLRRIFNEYGDVNAVVLSESSTARKGIQNKIIW